MNHQNKSWEGFEEWIKRCNKTFAIYYGTNIEFCSICGINPAFLKRDIEVLVAQVRLEAVTEERERVKMMIVKEINIAHSEGTPTARLTSLYNALSVVHEPEK